MKASTQSDVQAAHHRIASSTSPIHPKPSPLRPATSAVVLDKNKAFSNAWSSQTRIQILYAPRTVAATRSFALTFIPES
ncbi:hypothetical protein LX36DRAFT_650657 [Colletotrichum falcatum]|nr:hypothetical protein LX36DRAFT_650657 [Colletotrichum falcatum]